MAKKATGGEKILKALRQFDQLTIKQLESKADIWGVTQRISELRSDGFTIETIKTKNGKTAYRLG